MSSLHMMVFRVSSAGGDSGLCVSLLTWLMSAWLAISFNLHQVNKVKAMMPQPGTTWYLKAAADLPTVQEDQSE